eukprot:TRINITY_DN48465_c0_g1_i1.p2 TRINITY_DN48465_c0_g1~~TRINITY_DN48465_c0_g1_i1.p2  ORF type:complete len:118 (+),score=35.03 TRINITY_DN48465_c0_g1_i1:75-428(+)
MLFYSFFKTLEKKGSEVIVELKNDMTLRGSLLSVDQHLNLKLGKLQADQQKHPQLRAVVGSTCFVRGNAVRYIHVAPADVDTEVLKEASRNVVASITAEKEKGEKKRKEREDRDKKK